MLYGSIESYEVVSMAGYVILGLLAAFGALCVLWLLLGLLLPRPKDGFLVYWAAGGEEERILRRYIWLWELGFVRCRLALVDSGLSEIRKQKIMEKYRSICFFTKEQWIEQEKEYIG